LVGEALAHLADNHMTSCPTVLTIEDSATTLCALAAAGNTEKLRLLLTLGVDPNVADYDDRTPLHAAASEGKEWN